MTENTCFVSQDDKLMLYYYKSFKEEELFKKTS